MKLPPRGDSDTPAIIIIGHACQKARFHSLNQQFSKSLIYRVGFKLDGAADMSDAPDKIKEATKMSEQARIKLMSQHAASLWASDAPPATMQDIQTIWAELVPAFDLTEDEELYAQMTLNALGGRAITNAGSAWWRALKEILALPCGRPRLLALVGLGLLASDMERREELGIILAGA